jgi:hypothetical protein
MRVVHDLNLHIPLRTRQNGNIHTFLSKKCNLHKVKYSPVGRKSGSAFRRNVYPKPRNQPGSLKYAKRQASKVNILNGIKMRQTMAEGATAFPPYVQLVRCTDVRKRINNIRQHIQQPLPTSQPQRSRVHSMHQVTRRTLRQPKHV